MDVARDGPWLLSDVDNGRRRRRDMTACLPMTLAHDRRGSGDPLVLIHGTGSFRRAWDPLLARLAQEREVIALDLPGFGDSAPLPAGERATASAFAVAVAGLLDELGLRRPNVAGNSLGGEIAMELAARRRAGTVTGISPTGFWTDLQAAFCRRSLAASAAALRALDPAIEPLARTRAGRTVLYSQLLGRPWRMDPEAATAATRNFAGSPATDATIAEGLRGRFDGDVPAQVPVTIAWGSRDRLMHPGQAARALERIPHARRVLLPGCGHVPMSDDPGMVARVVLDGSRGDG